MRLLNTIGILLAAATVAACAEEDAEVPFDPTTQNLSIRGSFTGFEFDISDAEIAEVEREYSPTRLCEVSTEFTAVIDGVPWSIDFEFENFNPDSFGVGELAVISSDVAAEAGQTSFEMRMEGDAAQFERSAIGGVIDIRVYESAGTRAGSPGVLKGGSIGAVFQLDFGAGETVEGSFHVDFSTTTVEDEDC